MLAQPARERVWSTNGEGRVIQKAATFRKIQCSRKPVMSFAEGGRGGLGGNGDAHPNSSSPNFLAGIRVDC